MNNDPSRNNSETTITRIRNILREYRGMPLDENLSKKIEEVCLDLRVDSAQQDAEITEDLGGVELPKVSSGLKERRKLERRNKDKIIEKVKEYNKTYTKSPEKVKEYNKRAYQKRKQKQEIPNED